MLINPKFIQMNCFKRVHCAKGSDLFARVGKRSVAPIPSSEDIIPLNQRKLDMIEDMQAYDRQMQIAHVKKMQEEYARKMQEENARKIAQLEDENKSLKV